VGPRLDGQQAAEGDVTESVTRLRAAGRSRGLDARRGDAFRLTYPPLAAVSPTRPRLTAARCRLPLGQEVRETWRLLRHGRERRSVTEMAAEDPQPRRGTVYVREIARTLLRMWRKSDLEFVIELGVTELLTNVLKHTPGDCELMVRETPDGILVGVTDFEDALPAVRDLDDDAEGGRGLFLLSCLADELQAQPLLYGKRVWFRISHGADREEGR
jgi:anti-sigma regulatory factor (Ser/Thr protein kinase)